MKLRYMILAVPVFFSYGTFTYAATKDLGHDDSYSNFGQDGQHEHVGYHEDHQYDFKDQIKALVKSNAYSQNVYLRLCKNDRDDDEDDHDYGHDDGWDDGWDDDHNEVPVPAAAWLFAPSLLGLLGIKRKKIPSSWLNDNS
jgi:hypothetical protein